MLLDDLSSEIRNAAQTVWEFHRVGSREPRGVYDLLLVTGSHDLGVARWAAKLVLNPDLSFAKVVVSGGTGHVTAKDFSEPEASLFASEMSALGVPAEALTLEVEARNSAENIVNSRSILGEKACLVHSGLLVTKPYMERRMIATAAQQWSDVAWEVTSANVDLATYLSECGNPQRALSLMAGDVQRIQKYGQQGFLVVQEIPEDVILSTKMLVEAGYDEFVIS